MILYRLSDEHDRPTPGRVASSPVHSSYRDPIPIPPGSSLPFNQEKESDPSDSTFSSGSQHTSSALTMQRRSLIAYPYDPLQDEADVSDEDDLHDPSEKGGSKDGKGAFPWRGILNVSTLILLIFVPLTLFVFYPAMSFYRSQNLSDRIKDSTGVNPNGLEGRRLFVPGKEPSWEAMNFLRYGVDGNVRSYDSSQATIHNVEWNNLERGQRGLVECQCAAGSKGKQAYD